MSDHDNQLQINELEFKRDYEIIKNDIQNIKQHSNMIDQNVTFKTNMDVYMKAIQKSMYNIGLFLKRHILFISEHQPVSKEEAYTLYNNMLNQHSLGFYEIREFARDIRYVYKLVTDKGKDTEKDTDKGKDT